MKSFFKHTAPALALLGLSLGSCKPDLENSPKSSAGQADFSRYVAVGNSLTAGFGDNGLYLEGQLNSYPNILAGQLKAVGGGDFAQPLFTDAQANGSGYLSLAGFTGGGNPITVPVTTNRALRAGSTAAAPLFTKFTDPVNNLGVPGIRMSDINTPGYGSVQGNPYFERITPDATPFQTYLGRVQATVASLKPTFFTEWLGNNDVLGFATAGGAASSLTPPATFAANTSLVLDALTAGGAKGVVVTIPDVTGIPFFTTVGPGFRATLTANSVPGVLALTGAAPGGAASGNRKQIATVDIRDAAGAGRQLFTLTSAPFLPLLGRPTGAPWRSFVPRAALGSYLTAYGIDTLQAFGATAGNPIPSAFILDDVEQVQVQNATTAFNTTLAAAANQRNLALFDANTFFSSVARNGLVVNGVNNTASFISGNLFSLDGVHPTPRGYAVIANEMIKAINAKYGSAVPGVDATKYRGVRFPQ
ncbi:outer membrane protein [Hymenobacter frigidus]|uniref:Outer membrane protein n=1 Tax=Hymenobacter frigidus TaxID=1524095 RepID=A0ABQ2A922_9BACT|nr:G-D-S-L family lipolytic protein [Hymenobacter frigidus]GGH86668.1 outer membrane protein [Hymenobacter frigidus]